MKTIQELLAIQQQYENDGYLTFEGHDNKDGKITHASFHLSKMCAKVAPVLRDLTLGNDPKTEVLENEVIPDLMFYFLHLSLLTGFPSVDTQKSLEELQKEQEVLKNSEEDQKIVLNLTLIDLVEVIGKYASPVERMGHGIEASIDDVVPRLLDASLNLANILEVDVESKYLERLKKNRIRIDNAVN
jgi:hypothetical protein